jgi:hypothetical protein
MEEKFTLIVEGTMSQGTFPIHDLELNGLVWRKDSPPDIVVMPGGLMLVKVGKYTSTGERWRYKIADIAHLVGGRLGYKDA